MDIIHRSVPTRRALKKAVWAALAGLTGLTLPTRWTGLTAVTGSTSRELIQGRQQDVAAEGASAAQDTWQLAV